MAIGLRDVAQLEEITEIPDGAEILVIVDGVAKKISRENANLGGGSTIFYAKDTHQDK